MKREDLKELGLEKEAIDKIMDLNGVDIEAEKAKTIAAEGERDNFKEKFETATDSLEKFKDVDPAKLNETIEDLNTKLAAKDTEHQAKLADMQFTASLEKAVQGAGARNSKAVLSLLDMDALKASKNQTKDIEDAIAALKTDNDFLFGSTEPINNPTLPTGGGAGGVDSNTTSLRAAMGLSDTKKEGKE